MVGFEPTPLDVLSVLPLPLGYNPVVHLLGVDPKPFGNLPINAYKASRTAECFRWFFTSLPYLQCSVRDSNPQLSGLEATALPLS